MPIHVDHRVNSFAFLVISLGLVRLTSIIRLDHPDEPFLVFLLLVFVFLVDLLLHDVEVVPVPEPHGQDGGDLQADAQGVGQGDLRRDQEKAEPRVPGKRYAK